MDQGVEGKSVSLPSCGIVMPISECDNCPESHWKDVLNIFEAAAVEAGFTPNLVSEATDVGVIQKRIVQNLYENAVVLCDVSGKNPNVMFELGMRLAFDKPVVIVKDDKTAYSFDTSPVEHLGYPRDLRYQTIVEFQRKLCEKIRAAHERGNEDSFLKSFGTFKVASIDTERVPATEILTEELRELRSMMQFLMIRERRRGTISRWGGASLKSDGKVVQIRLDVDGGVTPRLLGAIKHIPGVLHVDHGEDWIEVTLERTDDYPKIIRTVEARVRVGDRQ